MKTLHFLAILLVFSFGMLSAHAMLTPFFGHYLPPDFVNEQLRTHKGWIAVLGTNSSQDYVGPGQCSPFFDLYMRQGSLAYPHLRNIALDLLTPTKITENQTVPLQLKVTNNENRALYNVTVLDWATNEFFDLQNFTKIGALGPHQSKTISGKFTFATDDHITCFHYNGGESIPALGYQVSAINGTGSIAGSGYFVSRIAVTILPPFKQIQLGIPKDDVECNKGLQLVMQQDGFPVCVKPATAQKLIERGWGVSSITSIHDGTLSGNVVRAGGPRSGPQANYEVDVYASDGITIVGKTLSDTQGNYSISLPAGNYTIYASDYPTKQTHHVSVISGKNTILNISYGTGYK